VSFLTLGSKEASLLLTWFTVTFFSGFLLANPILICVSIVPLFIYFSGFFITPLKVQIKKADLPSSVRLDEIADVKIDGEITGGPGAVVICDEVPKPFQLVEGSNYQVVSKGFRDKAFSVSYKIRCTKCGNYILGGGWETRHIFGLNHIQGSTEVIRQLRVFPRLPKISKMKLPTRRTTKIQPSGSVAEIGPLSTDFKEIRNYFYGDPFKIINWKATARAAGWGKLYPLVNEYEREGKLSVWLFLDSNPDLMIGTSIENVLEYGKRLAYIIAYCFLSKGYNLGMYIYNHRGETFQPDTGKKQFIKIAEGLMRLAPLKTGLQVFWGEGFSQAVERNQRHLITQSPRVVIVTHLTLSNWSDFVNGVRKILAYRRRRERPNILVVNILPYDIIPKVKSWETSAAKMLNETSRNLSNGLRNMGLTVLDWNPKEESTETALLNTVRSG
jgi:uncharacterized protein (DUF58 family)